MKKLLLSLLIFNSLFARTPAGGLEGFCREKRLDCKELKEAVQSVRASGRLPAKFITIKEAKALGWQPGSNLAQIAPGKSIGGDRLIYVTTDHYKSFEAIAE